MTTDAWGITDGFHDLAGQWHSTSDETRAALRATMGDAATAPSARIVREGGTEEIDGASELTLEDGALLRVTDRLPPAQLSASLVPAEAAALPVVDLAGYAPRLFDWSDEELTALTAQVAAADIAVFASPTYKATYTGLLKLFLDRIGTGALTGVTAVPVMLGGDWRHSLASDVLLKPVLVELGATCPTRGLFLLDKEYAASETLDAWLAAARPQVLASAASRT